MEVSSGHHIIFGNVTVVLLSEKLASGCFVVPLLFLEEAQKTPHLILTSVLFNKSASLSLRGMVLYSVCQLYCFIFL